MTEKFENEVVKRLDTIIQILVDMRDMQADDVSTRTVVASESPESVMDKIKHAKAMADFVENWEQNPQDGDFQIPELQEALFKLSKLKDVLSQYQQVTEGVVEKSEEQQEASEDE
jgi:hypothetical protein